ETRAYRECGRRPPRPARAARPRRASRDHSGLDTSRRRTNRRRHRAAIRLRQWHTVRRRDDERVDERAVVAGAGAVAIAEHEGVARADQADPLAASALSVGSLRQAGTGNEVAPQQTHTPAISYCRN